MVEDYRIQLAKQLRGIRKEAEPNSREKARGILSKEQEKEEYKESLKWHDTHKKGSRMLSDQALNYLSKKNIFLEGDVHKLKELLGLSKKEGLKNGLTYKAQLNPHLNGGYIYFDSIWHPISSNHGGNKRYWEERGNFENKPIEREKAREIDFGPINDIIHGGPCGHGCDIIMIFRGDGLMLDGNLSALNDLISGGYESARIVAFHPMRHIDLGMLKFPKYESEFKNLYELFTDIAPRLITLLSRDSGWQPEQLEHLLKKRLNVDDLRKTYKDFDYKSREHLRELVKSERWTEENKPRLIEDLKQFTRVFGIIDDYLNEKVKYANEKREVK